MSDLNETSTFNPNELLNAMRLRTILKGFTSEQLESLVNRISKIIEEVKLQEKVAKEIEAKKQETISEILELIKDKGITLEDLSNKPKPNRTKGNRKAYYEPKYSWVNNDGTIGYWSGQGATPTALRDVMTKTKVTDKSAYLIKKPDTETESE